MGIVLATRRRMFAPPARFAGVLLSLGGAACLVDFPEPAGGSSASGGPSLACDAPALAKAARALAPGGMVELSTQGFTGELVSTSLSGGTILSYGYKGVWDAKNCQALYLSGADNGNVRFIRYDGVTNTWDQAADPDWICDVTRSQDCEFELTGNITADRDGKLYVFMDRLREIEMTRPMGSAWTTLPTAPLDFLVSPFGAIEFFPERDALVWLAYGDRLLLELPRGGARWSELAPTGGEGDYPAYAAYSPTRGEIMFAVDRETFRTDILHADGSVTAGGFLPLPFGNSSTAPEGIKILTADPATGAFLGVTYRGDVYAYDSARKAWNDLPVAQLDARNVDVAIPIPELGVLLLLTSESTPRMLLYKHA
jgi:hypothetical protein